MTKPKHKTSSMLLNVHAIMPVSYVNGPGARAVVWTQGCRLRCPGCSNPLTHSHKPRILADPADTKNQSRNLKRKISEAQGTIDALLLKAAAAEDNLSAGFMRLAKEKHNEITMLQGQIEQIEKGK